MRRTIIIDADDVPQPIKPDVARIPEYTETAAAKTSTTTEDDIHKTILELAERDDAIFERLELVNRQVTKPLRGNPVNSETLTFRIGHEVGPELLLPKHFPFIGETK